MPLGDGAASATAVHRDERQVSERWRAAPRRALRLSAPTSANSALRRQQDAACAGVADGFLVAALELLDQLGRVRFDLVGLGDDRRATLARAQVVEEVASAIVRGLVRSRHVAQRQRWSTDRSAVDRRCVAGS